MLQVTKEARERLTNILKSQTDDLQVGLRFQLADNGAFSIMLDTSQRGDANYMEDNRRIVIMSQELAERLNGHTLDLADKETEQEFVIY
jgi:Fe-S cluster assembly iron-binding protein IscA